MTTNITDRLGLSVLYTLGEADARTIIERRRAAGSSSASGNDVREGDTFPALIVRDNGWGDEDYEALRERTAMGKYLPNGVDPDTKEAIALIADQLAAHEKTRQVASVNLQVFLDGNDSYWATSRGEYTVNDREDGEKTPKGRWQRHPMQALRFGPR